MQTPPESSPPVAAPTSGLSGWFRVRLRNWSQHRATPAPELPLPLLLITFPLAIALARTPWVMGMVFAAYLLLARQFRCLWPFLLTYLAAFALNLPVLSAFSAYSDADAYIGPQTRQLASSLPLIMDGLVSEVHLALPMGYSGWCAALYRLTGALDFGHAQIFVLLVAAWQTLRTSLTQWQTFALVCAPLTFVSIYNAMPDGCVYLLLLIALFALKDRRFWLTLTAIAVAATYKTSAWLPGALLGAALLWRFPRKWPHFVWMGLGVTAIVFPTLRMMFSGGLSNISSDFLGADAAAKDLGRLARLVYFYLGHWLVPGAYDFNVHIGGADGAGMDGLGRLARVIIWPSLAGLILWKKRLTGWWTLIILSWASVLLMPTLYTGYGRYVPLAYVALMLPLVVRWPKTSSILAAAMAIVPALWCAWRIFLSVECAQVVAAGGPVHSKWYNVRAGFRSCGITLAQEPLPVMSSSYAYSYEKADFPPFPGDVPRERMTPAGQKAMRLREYAFSKVLPWIGPHLPTYLAEVMCIRWHWLTSPRGMSDGLPKAEPSR